MLTLWSHYNMLTCASHMHVILILCSSSESQYRYPGSHKVGQYVLRGIVYECCQNSVLPFSTIFLTLLMRIMCWEGLAGNSGFPVPLLWGVTAASHLPCALRAGVSPSTPSFGPLRSEFGITPSSAALEGEHTCRSGVLHNTDSVQVDS